MIGDGIIVVNKPAGMSSFLVVKLVKRFVGAKKAGHMGTLDPMADGVLVVGINKGTKLFDKFLKSKKEYISTFKFGAMTDTLDREGTIVKEDKACNVKRQDVEEALKSFVGKQMQMPPLYSAKKVGGKRACDIVRAGGSVELSPKEIEIYSLELLEEVEKNTFKIKMSCSSGTYVRSLCRDLAQKLTTCGTVMSITRTICCGQRLEDAFTLEEIKEGKFALLGLENFE